MNQQIHENRAHDNSVIFDFREATKVRNITLSADDALIEAARRLARENDTTLNSQFRIWLESYVGRDRQAGAAMETISRLSATLRSGGRRFTREEMNER